MSWDILIMDLPQDVQAVSELPGDFKPGPLGNRDELIAEILDRLSARALDIQTGEMFEERSAARSLAAWRAYRDQVVNGPG